MKPMTTSRTVFFTVAVLTLFRFYMPGAADAAVVLHSNLQDLTQKAGTVFVGTCVSVSRGVVRFDDVGELGYTEYTFTVREWIKGTQKHAGVIAFRQPRLLPERIRRTDLLAALSISADALLRPAGYVAGHEYLLFLHPANKWGLTSPVGSVQGAFDVRRRPSGELEAVNGIDNLGLFKDMAASAGRVELRLGGPEREMLGRGRGPVNLDSLLPLARRLAEIPSDR